MRNNENVSLVHVKSVSKDNDCLVKEIKLFDPCIYPQSYKYILKFCGDTNYSTEVFI